MSCYYLKLLAIRENDNKITKMEVHFQLSDSGSWLKLKLRRISIVYV